MSQKSSGNFRSTVLTKITPSTAAGGLVFGIGAWFNLDAGQNVQLSVLVGGIVLLTEILHDFEEKIERLRTSQREGLTGFSEATYVHDKVARSPVDASRMKFLEEQVGELEPETHRLMIALLNLEIHRMGAFVKQLHESAKFGRAVQSGVEQPYSVAYHGEDREWLLGLTTVASKSIDAISLSTIDAGVNNYDGGLWRSDLGHRYLELQRVAIRRGLEIRRIFYFDRPEIQEDAIFRGIVARQKAIGVNVRILDEKALDRTPHLKALVSDFIVFDSTLGYETSSDVALADGHRPERLMTFLTIESERVQDLQTTFEQLWSLAHESEWMHPKDAE